MIFDKDDMLTIISQENPSIDVFLKKLEHEYPNLKNDNLVLDLSTFAKLTPYNVLAFLELSKKHRKNGKSFVMVSDKVSYNDVPEEINLVPTRQEAKDIIEMEEIERDLEL